MPDKTFPREMPPKRDPDLTSNFSYMASTCASRLVEAIAEIFPNSDVAELVELVELVKDWFEW